MMHMTFYWGKSVTLLFDSWKTDSWTSYGLTLLACFLISVFYQSMEVRRLRFKSLASNNPSSPSIETPFLSKFGRTARSKLARFGETVLFGVNSAIGYLLMLAVMSFNGGVFLAIVLGLAVGYFLFRSGNDEVVTTVDNTCACS